MLETLKTLCCLDGPSGYEDAVRDYIGKRVAPVADELFTDAVGNLYVFKKGRRAPEKKVMLAAHMDEVGVIVTGITDDGYLKFSFVGGVDRRVVLGKQVRFGAVKGIIGLKAYHLVSDEEEKKVPKVSELYIDIGAADAEAAGRLVSPGDYGAFDSDALEFGDGMLKAKAIDDRVGCAAMIRLLESELPVDCWFVFTVQEEVGTRGAAVAAYRLEPELALVLEGTTAADLPNVEKSRQICSAGGGVVVPFMDGGTIYDRELYDRLTRLAEERKIPWQTKQYISGGTDASAIQRSRGGVQTAGLAVPVRYIHAPASAAAAADIQALFDLAAAFLESL